MLLNTNMLSISTPFKKLDFYSVKIYVFQFHYHQTLQFFNTFFTYDKKIVNYKVPLFLDKLEFSNKFVALLLLNPLIIQQ